MKKKSRNRILKTRKVKKTKKDKKERHKEFKVIKKKKIQDYETFFCHYPKRILFHILLKKSKLKKRQNKDFKKP